MAEPRPKRFKPYPAYKDSGVEWLREIPAHWEVARISERAMLINGFPFDSACFVRGEGLPLVRIRDLDSPETEVNYVGPPVETAWIDRGDVIVGMDGDFNVARWRGPRALLNQRMCCLRSSAGTNSTFLSYVLPIPLQTINDLTYATTVKHLSSLDVRRIRFGAPPNMEQTVIAVFLDRETARIDALVAKKERLIELLQEKRTALITRAVTKGLEANVRMKDSGVEWLGEIPEQWQIKPLKAVSTLQTGLTLGKTYEGHALVSRPYLRVANVQDGYLDLGNVAEVRLPVQDVPLYELRDGDVLMTEGGDFDKLGRGHVWEGKIPGCLHQNHVFAVRPHGDVLTPRFLAFTMSSGYGRAYFTATSKQSTNLASTNSTKLRNLPIGLPSRLEQERIVSAINTATARFDTLTAKVRAAIDRLLEYRTALISAAVTGKIDVREEVA